jgi:thioredoxin reductase
LLEVNIPHDKDHVPTDLWMRAELPGIDAAGDVRQDSKVQAITSTGEGAVAAIAPYRHIKETFD